MITSECFQGKLDNVRCGSNNTSIKDAAADLLLMIGHDKWIYGSENKKSLFGFSTLASGNTWKWLILYMGKCYQDLDPVLKHCSISDVPLFWDSAQGMNCKDQRVKKFWKDVNVCGYGSGLSIPLRSSSGLLGLISVFSDNTLNDSRCLFDDNLLRIKQIGDAIHYAVERLMNR